MDKKKYYCQTNIKTKQKVCHSLSNGEKKGQILTGWKHHMAHMLLLLNDASKNKNIFFFWIHLYATMTIYGYYWIGYESEKWEMISKKSK